MTKRQNRQPASISAAESKTSVLKTQKEERHQVSFGRHRLLLSLNP